jgi:hypothetical protein
MKRTISVLALAGCVAATSLNAQFAGMPNWSSPKGGTGITISADLGMPNEELGKGTAFGARASLGLGTLTLTAGGSSWKEENAAEGTTSLGAEAAFRVIGGSLLPVAISLKAGGYRAGEVGTTPATTRISLGGAVAVSVPTPGVSIEPYLAINNRWYKQSGLDTFSNIGWTLGANVGLGMIGLHVAYDSESLGGATGSVLGIGAHFQLKAPIGM